MNFSVTSDLINIESGSFLLPPNGIAQRRREGRLVETDS
jgi:hypothetical protein